MDRGNTFDYGILTLSASVGLGFLVRQSILWSVVVLSSCVSIS